MIYHCFSMMNILVQMMAYLFATFSNSDAGVSGDECSIIQSRSSSALSRRFRNSFSFPNKSIFDVLIGGHGRIRTCDRSALSNSVLAN